MAAATASSIDLGAKNTFPIRLGPSILKPKDAKKYTSVRYNHRPEFTSSKNVQSAFKSSKNGTQEELTFKDMQEEYKYAGKKVGGEDRYVLLCRKSGGDTELVLERLDGCHEFNLVKTSTEADAAKLAAMFPQLSFEGDGNDDLFGDDEDNEEPVDPSNPWDYRNYLKAATSRPAERSVAAKDSGTSTPQAQPRAASSTPVSRPVKRSDGPLVSQKKRKPAETSKPNPKRVKAGTEPPPPTSTPSKPKSDLPGFKFEHKRVQQRRNSLDNSGELILELATPVTEKPPKQPSAMALALSGQLGQGPISLHTAASSPASRIASPNPPRPEGMEEGEEFDLGGSGSPEAPVKSQARQKNDDYFGGEGEEDEDADADVEDLELPSPAQTHGRRKSVAATNVTGGDDDDDELERQMMAAMADDDGDGAAAPAPPPAESEEESEEE